MFLGCGRKPESPEKTHAGTGRTCKLHKSALDDFEKQSAPPEPTAPASSSPSSHGAEKPPLLEDPKLFEKLFEGDMAAQAQHEWEKAMTELAQEEPDLLQHFQKLSEAAGKVGTDTASQQEFTSCLKDTLRGLAKNADNLQSSGLAGDDLVKTLEGLGLDEGGGGEEANILPIMQSIMQNLLSKEVLYPSLKEITTKYPEWLEANRSSLSPEDAQRYEQQAKVMGEICQRFEKEEDGDKVFESIMDLMQKLQDLGQPPKELAGDAPPGFNFDMDSLNLPGGLGGAGAAEQCSIM
ncbi:peroxisomal biogenesis factor 19 isoform X2 [Syngnathoides biaculeatus]|uniref:peroxisomal biogenesis factor 19 isoform X2 n=1 Tax=Syngnathoides biaculeatus TaxID=300417 RepID=UPI002ADDACA1|nr:peroxisomal biogenesis factor 19 isoform X2 [Syngnathoides biaculeatus]